MSDFDDNVFKELINKFYKVKKRVLKNRPLTTNLEKVSEYTTLLIQHYNSLLDYTETNSNELSQDDKRKIFLKISNCRKILIRCFNKINCNIKVPEESDLLVRVDENVMTESEDEDFEKFDSKNKQIIITETTQETEIKMATVEDKKSYITMCASIIRENYDGNPLKLQSFLDKIELIEDLTGPNLNTTFLNFVKSKLEAKAREALPDNISTVNDIKTALRDGIRPENSKVIAGKIAALSVKNNDFTDFAKQAEELADSLKRALVVEGITKAKAHEMAIEQTVSVCRLNARSTLVKSILASSVFKDPKEVVAKLVIEGTTEIKEQQVLAVRTQGRNRNNNFNNFRNNTYRDNNLNQFRNNAYRGNNFNQYRNNSYRGNNRGNSSSSNYPRTNHNFNNNYRGNNANRFSRNNNNSRASVRSLNAEVPQQQMLREEEEN